MNRKFFTLFCLFVLAATVSAQTTKETPEDDAKLEKSAIDLLRDTSAEVGRLRTMENRISFNAELASLMWFHDDKEARAMYGSVVNDFKQLLSQLDAQMNNPVDPDDDDQQGGFFGGYGKSRAERKLRMAMEVRKQIALSIAEHAPDLAYNFFYDSLNMISSAEFRKSQEQSDAYFESTLMQQIAESDAAKGVDYGKESMKSGVSDRHLELLKKIYKKDQAKGIEFGSALLSKLKDDSTARKNIYFLSNLLTFADQTFEASKKAADQKPVYERTDVRDIAEILADSMMQSSDEPYFGFERIETIGKYSPGRAAQLRAKFKLDAKVGRGGTVTMAMNTNASVRSVTSGGMMSNSNTGPSREEQERESRQAAEKKLFEDLSSLGGKPLPKEERDKIIAQSRRIIAETPGRDKKIMALSLLAGHVARLGDKDLAGEIMRDAERYANPQPKNYKDFLLNWMLASGYAAADPDKAFPLLESTILRANDTLSAFVKVGEFVDVGEEMVVDGEVQVGMFGGQMVRGITKELGLADSTIKTLAKADFQKTVNLTNTFDRPEMRILSKMLVLRSILEPKKTVETTPETIEEMSTQMSVD